MDGLNVDVVDLGEKLTDVKIPAGGRLLERAKMSIGVRVSAHVKTSVRAKTRTSVHAR